MQSSAIILPPHTRKAQDIIEGNRNISPNSPLDLCDGESGVDKNWPELNSMGSHNIWESNDSKS